MTPASIVISNKFERQILSFLGEGAEGGRGFNNLSQPTPSPQEGEPSILIRKL